MSRKYDVWYLSSGDAEMCVTVKQEDDEDIGEFIDSIIETYRDVFWIVSVATGATVWQARGQE